MSGRVSTSNADAQYKLLSNIMKRLRNLELGKGLRGEVSLESVVINGVHLTVQRSSDGTAQIYASYDGGPGQAIGPPLPSD